MKNYKSYDDYRLSTAGSGHSIPVLGRGNLDVASKSDSAENPGTFLTFIVHLEEVMHAPLK